MRTMVFDVPAENGGALTILEQYHDTAIKDADNEWIFVVSIPKLEETENVKVLRFPWVKKSWLHRLYFDKIIAHKLVKKYNVDEILSLQNVIISGVKIRQVLYLHNSLPFVKKRYGIIENFRLWTYQNVVSKIMFRSIKQAEQVIVQTQWMIDACVERVGVNEGKFLLQQPKLNQPVEHYYTHKLEDKLSFFYPASGLEYKNHNVIVEAVANLNERDRKKIEVIFTLKGDENSNIRQLFEKVAEANLPIEFHGSMDISEVYAYYAKSILIFPSYIETFGLPLLEARECRCPIIASDCAFSHEILDGYSEAQFFEPLNYKKLSSLIAIKIVELDGIRNEM